MFTIQFIFSFLTTWSLIILMVLIKKKNISASIEHALLSYILTCSILGTIFLNLFGHNIIFLKREYIFIIDFLTHIIPLIYISFYYKKQKIKNYNLKYLVYVYFLSLLYVYIINAKNIYFFTKLNNFELFIIGIITYTIIYFRI